MNPAGLLLAAWAASLGAAPATAPSEAAAWISPTAAIHVVTPAEGAVYAAFLDQTFAPVRDDGPRARKALLLENDALDAWTPKRRAWEAYLLRGTQGQGRADTALMESFLRRTPVVIRFYRFPAALNPVRLVRADVLAPTLKRSWDAFYDAYPKVQGVLSFSAAVFNAAGTEALFAARERCGTQCGYRDLVLMRQVNRAWTLVEQDSLP